MTRRQRAIYVCGPDPRLVAAPCPQGGPAHTPLPRGYGAQEEYVAQLMRARWVAHRCPACRLWALWRPEGGQAEEPPPFEVRDVPYAIPARAPSCRACREDLPCRVADTPA